MKYMKALKHDEREDEFRPFSRHEPFLLFVIFEPLRYNPSISSSQSAIHGTTRTENRQPITVNSLLLIQHSTFNTDNYAPAVHFIQHSTFNIERSSTTPPSFRLEEWTPGLYL